MTGKEMTGKDQAAHDPYRPMTKREMRQDHTALFLLMAGLIMLIATVLLNTGIPNSPAPAAQLIMKTAGITLTAAGLMFMTFTTFRTIFTSRNISDDEIRQRKGRSLLWTAGMLIVITAGVLITAAARFAA